MGYLFTSESVSEGHPDKVADQISDAILDEFLRNDPESKVACETLCTTGLVVVSGEVKSNAYVDIQQTVRGVIERIGYTNADYMFESKSCGVLSAIHEQSPDINQGVERAEKEEQGAGDQGIMFGYACRETKELMPASLMLSHILLMELADIRREIPQTGVMPYLRPDAKSQVTVEYGDDHRPQRIHTIVISTQSLIHDDYILHVNPTGKFVIGGPHGDTGLTGRKIIVDTYGGRGAHGGGAFSGKDSSKVDRSAAYAARHIAKNMVAAGIAENVLVPVAYAIGIARPVSVFVDTSGTSHVDLTDGQIAAKIAELFDLRPAKIVERYGLKNPIFAPTAAYGHFGREPYVENGIQFFSWEKLDEIDRLRTAFGL